MISDFWKEALTPTGLIVGLLLVMVGGLLNHVLSRIMKKKDDASQAEQEQKLREASQREDLLSEIVNKYLSIPSPERSSDILDLIRAGAMRAADTKLLLDIAERIKQHGKPDPLHWVRNGLSEAEFLPFIKWQAKRGHELKPFYMIREWDMHIARFHAEGRGQQAV